MKTITTLTLFFVAIGTLEAYQPKQGIKIFKQECISCHSDAHSMAQLHEQNEWEKLLFSSSTPMYDLHKNQKDIKNRFATKCGETNKEDLFAFLVDNAKDSGKVPGCN